jgi:hypothetical protein
MFQLRVALQDKKQLADWPQIDPDHSGRPKKIKQFTAHVLCLYALFSLPGTLVRGRLSDRRDAKKT